MAVATHAVLAIAAVAIAAATSGRAHAVADAMPMRHGAPGPSSHLEFVPDTGAETTQAATAALFSVPPWRPGAHPVRRPIACLAPGSTPEEVEALARELGGDEQESRETASTAQADPGSRWTATATDGCCLAAGDPTTLTYSFVPDGTPMPSGIGEPAAPSDLFAFLNRLYGSPEIWMPLFHRVFAEWSAVTGIRYVFQASDDGAAFPDAPGAIGVRGDVRIGGHFINGDGGVTAYNWLPSTGDMVIDTGDGHFAMTDGESIFLRNIVAHEHGHGIGLGHTCPIDETKLMEPIASFRFDGPQHDDTIAGQRVYGDRFERNDSAAAATEIGALPAAGHRVDAASIHESSDVDYYRINVGSPGRFDFALEPVGRTYRRGPQNGDGSCSGATSFDSHTQADLALDLLAADGSLLASSDGAPAGEVERIPGIELSPSATYLVRVRARAWSSPQIYELLLAPVGGGNAADLIFQDAFESGDLSAWTTYRDGRGQIAVGTGGALDGHNGMQIFFGESGSSYVTDRSPEDETRYRVRFLLDATPYLPASPTARMQILKVFSRTPSMRWMIILALRKSATRSEIQARVRLDDGRYVATPFLALAEGAHAIELDWQKGSAPNANDGQLRLWIDGAPASTLDRLDNDLQLVKHARFGAMGASRSASGSILLDGFVSRRQSYVGP